MKNTSVRLGTAALLVAGLPLMATAAQAHDDDDVENRGSCRGVAEWKIKVKPDDGRLEVEAEIDTSSAGQSWGWVLKHNGTVSARGTSRTTARSGSFEVERKTVDVAGVDTFRFRATRHGAVCVATVSY